MQVITSRDATYLQLTLEPRGFGERAGYPSLMRVRIDDYSVAELEKALTRYADESRGGTRGMHRMGSADLDADLFPVAYFNGEPASPRSLRDFWDGHLDPRLELHPTGLHFWGNVRTGAGGFQSERVSYEALIHAIRSWRAQQMELSIGGAMAADEDVPAQKSSGMSPL